MGGAIGDVLPLAFGVTVSPVPVIAVTLTPPAPRAGGTGGGFLFGRPAGIDSLTPVKTTVLLSVMGVVLPGKGIGGLL